MTRDKTGSTGGALEGSVTHLLHRALQVALDFHSEAAGPGAITQRQYTVLAAAAAHEGLSQNDLVRATGIDRSTLADLVARMLAKGLLARERSATDARANTVRLSEAGRTALAAGQVPVVTADDRLLAPLSAKKRDAFMRSLAVLAGANEAPAKAKDGHKKKGGKAKAGKKHKKHKKAKALLDV